MASVHTGIVHQTRGQTTIEYLLLEEVRVNAWVVDVSSRIVLIQTFYNPLDEPTAKAKYVFPVPANAAVCAFKLGLEDGSVILEEEKEIEEAALTHASAADQGRTTTLIESVTDDIFTISVGSIPAATRVTVHLTFVMDLLDEALRDHIRLQLPMHIAEQYGTSPTAMHHTTTTDSHTRVHIRVDIQTSDAIYDIRSPTHHGGIEFQHYKGRFCRKSQRHMSAVWKSTEFLASDFVITIYAEGLDKPRCFAEVLGARDGYGEGSTIAMQLTLVPKFQASRIPSQEYIFIIDRSGSMGGDPIETAKRALTMLLRLLPSTQTTFNIFSFGSMATSLWQRSRGLDRTSLVEATLHVTSMNADYGGTEIPNVLQSAFSSRGLDRPAVVFLLTDGQIYGNERLDPWVVISDAIRNSPPQAPVRLFVLGIGTGVSSDICSSLARQGNGEYLLALSAEDIYGKCARLLNAGRSKNIERIDIDWGHDLSGPQIGLSSPSTLALPPGIPALGPPPLVQQAPHSLKKIFPGIRFTVFAITSFKTVPTSVRLITKLEGVSETQELTVDVTKVKPFRDMNEHSIVPIVHTLAARKLMMELDDGVGPLPTPVPGGALFFSEDDLRKAGIVRLGLTYQLVSKHTSFVAVQRGDERRRDRGRGRGSTAWARSRLRQNDLDTQEDGPGEGPTFVDSLVDGVSPFITSVFGFLSGSVTSTGTFDRSDSSDDGSRELGHASSPSQRRSLTSRHSIETFSTLSTIEGLSCSSCWTFSHSPSFLPRFRDQIERAPSPEFRQDTSAQASGATNTRPSASNEITLNPDGSNKRIPISQQVYDLFLKMDVDGSFTPSPLLTQLVGNTVLNKGDELGIDRGVWATVVSVAYMKKHLQDEPDLLELVSEKAREFVEVLGGASADGERRFDQMVRQAAVLLSP